jgi:hypothetical protein
LSETSPAPLNSSLRSLPRAAWSFLLTLLLLVAGCTKIPTFVDPAKAWSLAPLCESAKPSSIAKRRARWSMKRWSLKRPYHSTASVFAPTLHVVLHVCNIIVYRLVYRWCRVILKWYQHHRTAHAGSCPAAPSRGLLQLQQTSAPALHASLSPLSLPPPAHTVSHMGMRFHHELWAVREKGRKYTM